MDGRDCHTPPQNCERRLTRLEERQDVLLRELEATRDECRRLNNTFNRLGGVTAGIVMTVSVIWGAAWLVWTQVIRGH